MYYNTCLFFGLQHRITEKKIKLIKKNQTCAQIFFSYISLNMQTYIHIYIHTHTHRSTTSVVHLTHIQRTRRDKPKSTVATEIKVMMIG